MMLCCSLGASSITKAAVDAELVKLGAEEPFTNTVAGEEYMRQTQGFFEYMSGKSHGQRGVTCIEARGYRLRWVTGDKR
jgi:hypothetical protein